MSAILQHASVLPATKDVHDAALLQRFLLRVTRRVRLLAWVRGTAAGLAIALAGVLVTWLGRGVADDALRHAGIVVAIAGAAAGGALALLLHLRRPPAAVLVEQRVLDSRNLIITAAELLGPDAAARPRVHPYVRAAVLRAAAAKAGALDLRRIFPAARPLLAAGAAAAAWTCMLLLMASRPAALTAIVPFTAEATRIVSLEVVIAPPSYVRGDTVRLRDPERVEALAGSRLRITVRAVADAVTLETLTGTQQLDNAGMRTFTADARVDTDGFLALEPRDAQGQAGARMLVGISVIADDAPSVRITTPGRDLILPEPDATLELELEAEDDHGLASLALRYTRVTGFGEQFTFLDGTVPLQIARTDERRWAGRATWALHGLELQRGDLLVYRALATDRRPGAEPGESETYVVEIGTAHVAAAGGYAGDEDFDRYALSQQMVIVLTERVMARRASLTADELAAEAQMLSAAQRRVRAEFVFMLGGELEDDDHVEDGIMELHEEAHARADADVLEGRLANQGRRDLVRAIQSMSHAVTFLNDANMEEALRAEQTALVFLQRAFSRSRYILRALSERERLDMSRRLTGSLAGAAGDARPRREAASDTALAALRRVIADAAALAAGAVASDVTARHATALAQATLRIDASAPALQDAAALFTQAANAAAAGRAVDTRARLDDALSALTTVARATLRAAPSPPSGLQRLEGALTDALRAGGPP